VEEAPKVKVTSLPSEVVAKLNAPGAVGATLSKVVVAVVEVASTVISLTVSLTQYTPSAVDKSVLDSQSKFTVLVPEAVKIQPVVVPI
jgi:hypothetical protein